MSTDKESFRIKPLEWEWFDDTQNPRLYVKARGYSAHGSLFSASVWEVLLSDGRWQEWRWSATGLPDVAGRECASPEEGKQLAEQHWREYIKHALIEASQQ